MFLGKWVVSMKLHSQYFSALSSAKELLSSALYWWLSELKALIPNKVVSFFSKPSAHLFLTPIGDQFAVNLSIGSANIEMPFISMVPTSAQLEDFKSILQEKVGKAHLRTIVDFDRRKLLIIYAEYPLTDTKTLRKILLNDFARITPFKLEDVYWEWLVHTRDLNKKRLVVKIALVKKIIVDNLISCTNKYELFPVGARLVEEEKVHDSFWHLLPQNSIKGMSSPRRVKFLAPAAIATLIFMFGGSYSYSLRGQASRLSEAISTMQPNVEEVERSRELLEDMSGIARELKERGRSPTALMTLNEITHLVPDDTWIFDYQFSHEKIRVSGFSPDPSRLIGIVSSSKLFSDARFLSPVTTSSNGSGQRFELSFSLKQSEAP